MKRLFTKFLREPPDQTDAKPNGVYSPKLSHLASYQMIQDRALIGWIVSRFAVALEIEENEREALFFMAFTTNSFDDIENDRIRELLQLARSAVEWIRSKEVVEEAMRQVKPTFSSKDLLMRVLNEVQSDIKDQERISDEFENVWEVYRDVIYAATHGRFLLITDDQIARYKTGDLICKAEICERKDIPAARNLAKDSFTKKGLKPSKTLSYNLIISEAITNILKHAKKGKMLIYQSEEVFHVVVEDTGPGFPLKILPKTTLMAGFSTKESLGQGFTLMMKMADQVILSTSSTGSTLILQLDGGKDDKANE